MMCFFFSADIFLFLFFFFFSFLFLLLVLFLLLLLLAHFSSLTFCQRTLDFDKLSVGRHIEDLNAGKEEKQ